MNEMLKLLYTDDTGLAKWYPKGLRNGCVRTNSENKLIGELESTLDESQKLLLKKLLELHIKQYLEHGEDAFTAGARTAARLIIELITDD